MAQFPDEESCIRYLSNHKWALGYCCSKCCSAKSKKGKKKHNKHCKDCGYEESPAALTLFHKIKLPLQKAFYICCQLSINKKGMSTLELSRQFGLSQKTCWFFKRKIQKAMRSSEQHPLNCVLEVDEFSIGSHEKRETRTS